MSRKITREAKEKPQAAPAEMRAAELQRSESIGPLKLPQGTKQLAVSSAASSATSAILATMVKASVPQWALMGAVAPGLGIAIGKLFKKLSGVGSTRQDRPGPALSPSAA